MTNCSNIHLCKWFVQRQADGVAQVRLFSNLDVDTVLQATPLLSCLTT
ncbi:MAG: hypothetical protein AAFY21_03980 [Cyanobacteria bacterium J06641_2]